jgi:hypothetical protein
LKWGKEELTIKALNRIIKSEEIHQQWQRSTIILVHKKGNRDLNNYRPISLLSNLYKLFTKIPTNRLAKIMDQKQLPEQAVFHAKYSAVDRLHTINQIIEKTQEYRQKIYMAFIDYRKAFNSVEHTKILDSMEAIAIHPKYIRLIREIYKNSNVKVRTNRRKDVQNKNRSQKQYLEN